MSVDTSDARSLPVLHREGVEGQDLDAKPGGPFDDLADRLDAGAMALDARQVTLCGPAAVAVHDDRHVFGEAVEVHQPRQLVFDGARRHNREDVVKRHGLGVKPR